MATPRDVQEIVSRLSSNKAKVREEGVKLLSSWLEGEKSFGFCRLVGQNTSMLRPDEIPHAETWPFLITLLTKCIGSEKVASKKSHPKLIWAKTLRTAIQRAEDPKFSGKTLLLLSVAKLLFNHIWEVIKDVPLFQSEYGIILRHLLSVKEYRYHMRMRVYSSLLLLYMKRIETSQTAKSEMHFNIREEIFRCILTLHILLECPPGDFPDNVREDIVKSFIEIFSQVREEGKISRKLMECMNTYLLKDGPNLGSKAMEIHCCLHDFIFRYWLTTHDRGLKNTFILYAKMQLKLIRRREGGPLIDQLLDVIGKELDQAVGSVGMSWSEATRDDKIGPPTSSQQGLMEIAASVLYQASVNPLKASGSAKRLKREGAFDRLRDGLMKGKWLWCGAFCFLIHNYGIRIEESSIINWLKGISESLERILNDSCNTLSYDGVLWILRGLQELCFVLSHSASKKYSSPTSDEVRGSWKTIWSCLMHGLPMFSNVTHVADAALILLGNIILENLISTPIVPQEVWELQIFKHMPSLCALYFITCYFSRGGVQGSHCDVLHLRKNLLRAALRLINSKESVVLDKHTAMVLPAAIFSLCAGYCPFQPSSICPEHLEEWSKSQIQESDEIVHKFLEYSVEALAEFECRSDDEASGQENHHSVRLPEEVKQQMIHDMEQYFIASISFDQEIEKKVVPNVFFSCLFLSNCVYSLSLTRLMNEKSLLFSKMLGYMSKLLELIVSTMEEKHNELQLCDSLSLTSISDFSGSALASLCCFIRCPLLQLLGDGSDLYGELNKNIVQSIENLLLFLAKLFEDFSGCTSVSNMSSGSAALFPSAHSSQHLSSLPDRGTRIIDVELDVDEGSNDLDSLGISGDSTFLQWKMDMISTISVFFTVLPVTTCEVMVDLLEKESDPKVSEYLLVTLCKCFPPSDGTLASLVTLVNNMMDSSASPKIPYSSILGAISGLLGSLVSSRNSKRNGTLMQHRLQTVPEQNLAPLGVLVKKIAEENLSDWSARVVLIECICHFILLDPSIGQGMITGLFVLLKDPDYRVRLFLARRIGILFQTWDGHNELLHDICSNFGLHLVMATKDKLVKADEVLAADSQSHLSMETAVITLAHLALYSDKVELEVVFMICAVAAISPDHRDIIYALLDNISRHLLYSSRLKYLEELLGPIVSRWITCELSLIALVEVRDLFVAKDEAKPFMQLCCQWLIPLLLIRQDMTNLNLVSTVADQPLSLLMKKHFVKVFAICMALCCSSKAEKEAGEVVLSSSMLQIAEISEHERDDLIKKYMVSIVSCLLSLSSASSDPPMPFFAMETVVSAIQTVVDGFLEIDNCPCTAGIIDKLNIFRPDRVFKFLVEIHYLITSAVHPRHKCNRLSAVEVLVKIIGHRAAVSSTSLYVFNLVGQFIVDPVLQDQCCAIVSTLLLSFRGNDPTKDGVNILGEQLQLLISKLVVCCAPDDSTTSAGASSSKIVSLLEQLIVDADSSLYDYIRELEPLPDIACFQRIQKFHKELCRGCSPRDDFLKFVKKISHLPCKLILWSLRTLHANLLLGKIFQPEIDAVDASEAFNCWTKDPELVSAVWTLVGVCASSEVKEISSLVADFISRVGIGDPHRIVFHLPGIAIRHESYGRYSYNNADDTTIHNGFGVSEEVLVNLLGLLKKYLLDDGVAVVDITARTLRGILSTELGQRAVLTFNAYDTSLISVHSKGVNSQLVEKLILDCEGKSIPGDLSEVALWKTRLKSYEMWICPLVHSLIYYSRDNILRLCLDIVLLKVEAAELLLPSVLVNLSGRRESENDLCQLISKQVEENIFLESNYLLKSIQVWLDALNVLRSHHVSEKAHFSPVSSKHGRSSGLSRASTPEKSKNPFTSASLNALPSSMWKKVYWLSIDYLVVAKAAIHCGLYFTAVMYVEYWCEENFKSLTLGSPDFSHHETLPPHIELLVSAVTQINEPDSIYGIIQTSKVSSQIITHEHEGNWNKALEYYDLLIRKEAKGQVDGFPSGSFTGFAQGLSDASSLMEIEEAGVWKLHKGLMRSLQQIGCSHVLNVYLQGLANQRRHFQHDRDFTELQYEAAWRAGSWDFSLFPVADTSRLGHHTKNGHYNENLHSCLRALHEGDCDEFHGRLIDAKKELVLSISNASKESTEYINSTIVKIQILDNLGMAWNLRWKQFSQQYKKENTGFKTMVLSEPITPTISQMECMDRNWKLILKQTQLHLNLLEPFIAFRHILLQILRCKESVAVHLLESASVLRKGSRLSLAAAALHEFKLLCGEEEKQAISCVCSLGRLEEAKILRAQGQQEMAINLARYVLENYELAEEASNVYRLVGKWLAESRSSSSRTILEQYLKCSVELAELNKNFDRKSLSRQCQTYFHLAHYTDALFKSYEERLTSSEWQAALRLRKHKTRELDALIRRLKNSAKGDKTDYSAKIQELQKQLTMDREEAEKLQDDRDNFLGLALEGYQHCLMLGGKYDLRVVFRLVSLWFCFPSRQNIVRSILNAVKEVQSHKFIPLVYQIASRMGNPKEGQGLLNFQTVLVSLVKKMAIDHPYHTMFQLLALANGDRVKDKQRSRNSFIVDMDKKLAAENLLNELTAHHGAIIRQMKQMVDIYIKLAELETKREETNRRIPLPREIRSIRHLELVPVVTATFPVDPSCQYGEGSFPHFKGLVDSIIVMNGINAPKVVECLGSDGRKYRQLAKSGNDDLRQDAVMEQFFGLVNTFLQGNRDTWKRRLRIRTYKVVPFTPSAGVLEWVDQTVPLGEYLIGSQRNGGAHGRYGIGDWSFPQCREHMTNEKDKRKAFLKVCENFRPVMHYFFLERFLQPADWFEKRLSYTRSVAASSMVGYIVGLGDRHSMNILIDQSSAEVVHIDLGVAFEQGLMLKTPERVPFRLTRDIVDGMGVTGVDGVFRRCCEETLSVMRTNKVALLTIVEVFIHDPLYKWALSPLKALQRQKETDEDAESNLEESQDAYEGNKDAARALFRVKQKLDGYEDGEMRSVQGQVQQIIQDAIDTDRLCQMFPGWGAWL